MKYAQTNKWLTYIRIKYFAKFAMLCEIYHDLPFHFHTIHI